jgi:tRNA threonylcarbamoyladenosine biosynthesis protein TsaB
MKNCCVHFGARCQEDSLLLAIDTSTQTVGLALHDGLQLRAEHTWITPGHHTVELGPEVALMLRKAGCPTASLKAIAVARGPGSFTGLRIGMAFAKGLVLAHQIDLIGVPTLDILARGISAQIEPIFTVIRAGRTRIAGTWHRWESDQWTSQGEAISMTWEELAEQIHEACLVCGEISSSGFELLRANPHVSFAPAPLSLRRPGYLAEIGWERLRAGALDHPDSLAPIYLRTLSNTNL